MANRTLPFTNEEYQEQINKLQEVNAADSPERPANFHEVTDEMKEKYLTDE